MIENAEGRIVFATLGGGVRQLLDGDLVPVGSHGPHAPEQLLVGPDGALWAVGDGGHELFRLVEGRWHRSPVTDAMVYVEKAVFDDQGVLWIAGESGLVRFPQR